MAEKHNVILEYIKYPTWDELDEPSAKLLRDAAQAASKAYAPYSKFRVGAAIKLQGGRLVIGNNQENASFPAGCCAERVALHAAMATDPQAIVEVMAVVAPGMPDKSAATPCGVCRQALVEQENRQGRPMELLLANPGGEVIHIRSASGLMPLSFKGDFLSL